MTKQTAMTSTHKTLSNGSIDYDHYIRHSHELRSRDAHRALAALWSGLTGLVRVLNRKAPEVAKTEEMPAQDTGAQVFSKAA